MSGRLFFGALALAAGIAAATPGPLAANEPALAVDPAQAINDFGRCVARNQRVAQSVLALPFASAEQEAAVRRTALPMEACIGRPNARFASHLVVGGMAEELYRRHHRSRTVAQIAAADVAPLNAEEEIALCTIKRAPAVVQGILRSRPASRAETELVARLVPDYRACVPQGQTVPIHNPTLRALMAAGVYRLAAANL